LIQSPPSRTCSPWSCLRKAVEGGVLALNSLDWYLFKLPQPSLLDVVLPKRGGGALAAQFSTLVLVLPKQGGGVL
jgi:hypothetical protein